MKNRLNNIKFNIGKSTQNFLNSKISTTNLKKNAEMVAGRKAREIAAKNLERANKPGLFKNKGNKY